MLHTSSASQKVTTFGNVEIEIIMYFQVAKTKSENSLPIEFTTKVSWSENSIFDADNQLELKKLCEFKNRVSEKIE